MAPFNSPAPTHLSIFVTDPDSGQPVARLPLYAEVAMPRIVTMPPVNERFREPMRAALLDVDPTADTVVRNRVEEAALQALSQTVDEASRNELVRHPQRVRELFHHAFNEVLAAANRERMAEIPPADLKPLMLAALRRVAAEMGLALVPEVEDLGNIWADPLGVLTTDHVGYVSFDLKRLRPEVQVVLAEAIEARRSNPNAVSNLAIWIYPYGHTKKFDALSQSRFAFDAVVARLAMKWNTLPPALINMGPRALQNPSLTDWRLSAASFAASPKTLVGEDGCEELVPANLALQEFLLRQVVRLTDAPPGFTVPAPYKAAYVDDYKVSWFSLGHSLGEILYSLPLAPGETVKLAVIDWSWESLTKRVETTKLTEEVLHQTHRDRTITETVRAGLKELQHGSSFMAGKAHSGGATGSAGTGAMGIGAAVGDTWALGGSTATSDGSRDLAAENVQRLSDSFSQASSAQREINSTVVIQARQEEKESIQTRTFSNYNHSHTLTVLYYEVLRHYRVTVEWVRRRPAVLVQKPERIANFSAATLITNRFLLEPALLDQSLKGAFDTLEKQETTREHQLVQGITPSDSWTPQWWEGDLEFPLFEFGVKTAEGLKDKTDELVMVNAILVDGNTVHRPLLHLWEKGNPTDDVDTGERLNDTAMGWFIARPDSPIKWRHLQGFEFVLHDDDEWRMDRLAIKAFFNGGEILLVDNTDVDYLFLKNGASNTCTFIKRPSPPPAALPPAARTPEKSLSPEEHHQINKLIAHFDRYKDYYNRVILLATDPTAISIQFEGAPWTPGQTLADNADPDPLEVFGSYVAYPLAKQMAPVDDTVVLDIAAALNGNDPGRRQWALDRLAAMSEADRQRVLERLPLASAKSERLITMPTRGVFAEGKLGHCNVSEEIDDTRFWRWEEHPIPFEAPGINPVTPIQPQPQQVSATPTAFPQSLVNIVNPSPAPDPTGLGPVLSLLGTANIFRDMSGRQEVADLLKKLSDNTIAIAEAANRAREIQSKYGTNLDKMPVQQQPSFIPVSPAQQPPPKSTSPAEAQQEIKISENQANKGTITPEEHKENVKKSIDKINGGSRGSAVTVTINFKHSISGPLDGEFGVEFIGPIGDAFFTNTAGGVGAGNVTIQTGAEYTIQIKGKRTKLPISLDTVAHIPAVAGNPAFNLDVSNHISKRDVPIEANIVATITKGRKRINITIVAEEVAKDVKITAKVTGSGTLKADLEGELGLKLAGVDVGHVKAGAAVETTVGGEIAVEFPVEYKRLTGNVTAPKNELVL